jgi:hypothetical protein
MRPITDVLRDHRGGKLVSYLTEQFAELLEAVDATQKPGTLTLTLKVGPSKGDEDTREVTPNVKLSKPTKDLASALFYSDGEGSLLREPPKGGALFEQDEMESERERRRRGGTD